MSDNRMIEAIATGLLFIGGLGMAYTVLLVCLALSIAP